MSFHIEPERGDRAPLGDSEFENTYGFAREELKLKALELVNNIINKARPGHGVKRLQKGIKGDASQCTLAQSFAVAGFDQPDVDGESITLYDPDTGEGFHYDCGREGSKLVEAFDNGDLPELETGNPEAR